MDDVKEKKVKLSAYGAGSVTIVGLNADETKKLVACIQNGNYWINTDDNGRLVTRERREPLPPPTADENLEFWRPINMVNVVPQIRMFVVEDKSLDNHSPSIIIQHLCGYNYSEDNYKRVAEQLESFGFECLRSRRGADGKFWEIWFLPGLWGAKGALEDCLKAGEGNVEKAISFLCRVSSFGSLDVMVQRAAMVIE